MAQGHSPEAGTASERGVAGTSGSPRYAICLCVDRGMIVPAAFVACSVLSHARRPANPFDLIIVTPPGELNDGEKAFLRSRGIVVEESLSLAAVENIEIVQKRLSHATLLRLLLPAHYHGRYDRILYLDADLTIHGDVSTLFSLEMRDFPLAAVGTGRVLSDLKEEHAQKTLDHFAVLGMTPPYGYFNSGVMVMDLQNWLGEQLTEKALAFLRENPEICLLPDEDALNAVLDGRLVELSPIWNIRPERIRASNVDPVIIHFAGPNKPWNRFDRFDKPAEHRRALTQYRVFLRDAPWPGFLDEEGNIKARLERLKFDTARLLPRLKNRLSRETRQRRRRFCEDLGAYNASTPFADVDQGLAVRRGPRSSFDPARHDRAGRVAITSRARACHGKSRRLPCILFPRPYRSERMTKRLMQHATDTLAPAVSMVGKTKTPTKLVDRFQSLDIAAKVGGPPGVGGGSNRVVRKNTVSGATGQPV